VEKLLRRGSEVIPLPPKAIENAAGSGRQRRKGRRKQELMKAVWPDTFVEEGGLARNISFAQARDRGGVH